MDPAIVEFLAEKEEVEIIPNFSHDRLYLITGDVGPFRAGQPSKVPLWLAINLRQRQKCRLLAPEWMDLEQLTALKEAEIQSKLFVAMPSEYYLVVCQLILSTAPADIPRADDIRILVKDIYDIRHSKLRFSVDDFFKSGNFHAKLDNLTTMELNSIKPFLPYALDQLFRLNQNANASSLNNTTQDV